MNFSNQITERERQVLISICQEKTAKETANDMGLAKRSIESVKTDLFHKTSTKTIVGLALYAIKHKIYELN